MRLVRWTPDDLVRRLDDVVAVYGEAMGYRADLLEARRGYIATHVRRPGFRAVASLTSEGHLAGFGYGYLGATGQWWHDQVHRALDAKARQRWLARPFEVVELHVRPPAQGHGVGARQLRALLTVAEGDTTLLSTPEADERTSRAWRLYRRFGFVDVLRHFHFPGDERPFGVLGRDLPLPAAGPEQA
ncbi:GNAT family N-acetyltransferase [Micromonospora robiginosa]|uniref:GNAT family N-acetyltransferase n=1 Tax=Micromonospora robiginosa TaxID=2749844 RepID=A0A7L6B5E5_9ACTN|nr:GNAT family N-acetyltransferase [Micromonospora ferruginea]QLQ37055.1 GNAT family N-acetyltransferase [Micromonospora ferruginea]